jgi:predicted O-methyltransferase YrrM
LLKNKETILIEDLGAGSNRLLRDQRKIADIADVSSSPAKYGRLLHNIVSFLKPEIVIELGTCLGIGTMYLASGSEHASIYSIEGSLSLHELAKKNLQKLNVMNVFLTNGNFDQVLPLLLRENGKFDLIFIDGNHRKEAILKYFTMSLPYVRENSVICIDDIRWSEGMLEAWSEICIHEQVRVSLDLQNIGLVFFNRKLSKQHFKVYY